MTLDERLTLFHRDINIIMSTPDGILIFTQKGVNENYVQFNQRLDQPLYCEVTTRNWGGELKPLEEPALAQLSSLGYELPKPNGRDNAKKYFEGSPRVLAEEVEKIFREVFALPEDYDVISSGIFL